MSVPFQFKGKQFTIEKTTYCNKRIALEVVDEDGYAPYVATVNIPECPILPEYEDKVTFIKNWSENEGILEALIQQNIVKDTGDVFPTGFVLANLVEVLI